MRAPPILAVERYRVKTGERASSRFDGNNGAFVITHRGAQLAIIASDGFGWDHVSVSLKDRCPTWDEMCHVKDLFFEPEESAVQFHPPRSVYRNHHVYCLHLWRPQSGELLLPNAILVAPPANEADAVRELAQVLAT